jgi:hypothetical protein
MTQRGKRPRDKTPYPQDPRSAPASGATPDGAYVFVQDLRGVVWLLPDEGHMHPRVLGGKRAARYAGDLTIHHGIIADVTNLSGTFRFASRLGLRKVAGQLRKQGLTVAPGAVRFFPKNGQRPEILE